MADEWRAPEPEESEGREERKSWKLLEKPCLQVSKNSVGRGAGAFSSSC